MPGLSQLKQFEKDIQSLGDELTLRAARGEKPVKIPIPKNIKVDSDVEDFVLGMPEIPLDKKEEVVDDDLSDLTGSKKASAASSEEVSESGPDLSSLLAPVDLSGSGEDENSGMPDLSMFMDEPKPEVKKEVEKPKPVEISIADMGLDALLAGAGFDGSAGTGAFTDDSSEEDDFSAQSAESDINNLQRQEVQAKSSVTEIKEPAVAKTSSSSTPGFDFEVPEELRAIMGIKSDNEAESEKSFDNYDADIFATPSEKTASEKLSFDDTNIQSSGDDFSIPADDFSAGSDDFSIPADDFSVPSDFSSPLDFDSPVKISVAEGSDFDISTTDFADNNEFGISENDFSNETDGSGDALDLSALGFESDSSSSDSSSIDSVATDDFGGNFFESAGESNSAIDFSADSSDFSLDALSDDFLNDLGGSSNNSNDFGIGTDDFSTGTDDFSPATDDFSTDGMNFGQENDDFTSEKESFSDFSDVTDDFSVGSDVDSFDIPDFSNQNFGNGDKLSENSSETSEDPFADNIPKGLFDANDLDFSPDEVINASTADFSSSDFDNNDIGFSDFGDVDSKSNEFGLDNSSSIDFDSDSFDSDNDFGSTDFSVADDNGFSDIDLDSINETSSGKPDMDFGGSVDFDNSFDSDIPDYDDGGMDFESNDNAPIETFDTTGMEDMDFGEQETSSSDDGGDDFSFNDDDFEIPGFSDVDSTEEKSKGKQKPQESKVISKNKKLDIPDFSKAIPGDSLPPNTLSDEQYAKFLKNFNEYPLNVRLAFEDLIVQDEFTDDAEFEVIEKILNKAPARQIAAMLEKMLDTSIPVPRDFEHRTAEEYAAYKKSIQYQLKNKILPGALIFVLLGLAFFGLFKFTKNCIYIPAKATKYYKEGYTLLSADEYPQAQMKFDQASSYKMKKKWFYKYAEGYREHKQYQRAADIYVKALHYFNHDKQAGLEYADMELTDLSNYSKAEEITRRQILDYHINDAEGILLLGDIFLEWGTEKDPEKLELAKEQYQKLIQLYEANNLYNSRMMRYYIRSDNLPQVLIYKSMFEQDEKSIGADDWTELGGYLLGKMYGSLTPAEEPYKYKIEGLRKILQLAVTLNPENPVALYNLANYYINTKENRFIEPTLTSTIEKFNAEKQVSKRDMYKFIDTYRLLGENYVKMDEYLQAQEQYTKGITLYTTEKEVAGFEGNKNIGIMYADLADINYLLAGDYENAAINYKNSVDLGNDNPTIRYRLGYMSYKKKNYQEALGSFMKAGEGNIKQRNLLLAMANTLSLRNDDYAAEGYYEQLISALDFEIAEAGGSIYPQTNTDQYDLVKLYLYAANNYGVVLHKIAKRTGDSMKNAESIVQLQQSVRAWDSLTRNQTTLKRLAGSNLAEENIKYITHPVADFEPSIYIDIPKTLTELEKL